MSRAPNPRPDPWTSVIPEPPLSFERLSGPMPRPPASTRAPRSPSVAGARGRHLEEEEGIAMMVLRIGIANYEQINARTIAIASGEYTPAPGEPKAWFPSPRGGRGRALVCQPRDTSHDDDDQGLIVTIS